MDSGQRRILVTGGAGFIGSTLCRHLVQDCGHRVINLDKLTYAGNLASLETLATDPNYRFKQCDIADCDIIARLLPEEQIDGIIHLAAETHVDRSIRGPEEFIETNIMGTFRLLQTALTYWRGLNEQAQSAFRFHHVSTDEVFGDVACDEETHLAEARYRPSSPYSASKAAADHLVSAWHRTYGLPVVISNSTNTYGPHQFPDKLIPLTIVNALEEKPLPVYGTGANVRDWLYVDDHARALERTFRSGRVGQSYHFGSGEARSNLQVVRVICGLLDERRPRPSGKPHDELIAFVADRAGHDRRYAIDGRTTHNELGWRPSETFEEGLRRTVDWYLEREDWWRPLRATS